MIRIAIVNNMNAVRQAVETVQSAAGSQQQFVDMSVRSFALIFADVWYRGFGNESIYGQLLGFIREQLDVWDETWPASLCDYMRPWCE